MVVVIEVFKVMVMLNVLVEVGYYGVLIEN